MLFPEKTLSTEEDIKSARHTAQKSFSAAHIGQKKVPTRFNENAASKEQKQKSVFE